MFLFNMVENKAWYNLLQICVKFNQAPLCFANQYLANVIYVLPSWKAIVIVFISKRAVVLVILLFLYLLMAIIKHNRRHNKCQTKNT